MAKTKVKVTFTVEVDVKEWAEDFGIEVKEAPADIRQSLEDAARAQLAHYGY